MPHVPAASATVDQFQALDIRVGRVVSVEDFPEARKPLYRLTLDFGPLGLRRAAAALKPDYRPEELTGRLVVAVVNFPPRRIGPFTSEVLVLAAVQADGRLMLLQPDGHSNPGARIA